MSNTVASPVNGTHISQVDEALRRARAVKPVGLALEAEIMKCADTGRLELVVSDDEGTYEVRTAEQLRAKVAAARDKLTRLHALADQYEAITQPRTACFPWCDHQVLIGNVHESVVYELPAPEGMDREDPAESLLQVVLYEDDDLMDPGPHFSLGSGDDIVYLDEAGADKFLADLEAFTAAVRTLRQQQTEGRHA